MDEETATLRRGQAKMMMMMMKNIFISNEGVEKNYNFHQAVITNHSNYWGILFRYSPFTLESPSTFSSCFSLIIQSFYVLITS